MSRRRSRRQTPLSEGPRAPQARPACPDRLSPLLVTHLGCGVVRVAGLDGQSDVVPGDATSRWLLKARSGWLPARIYLKDPLDRADVRSLGRCESGSMRRINPSKREVTGSFALSDPIAFCECATLNCYVVVWRAYVGFDANTSDRRAWLVCPGHEPSSAEPPATSEIAVSRLAVPHAGIPARQRSRLCMVAMLSASESAADSPCGRASETASISAPNSGADSANTTRASRSPRPVRRI